MALIRADFGKEDERLVGFPVTATAGGVVFAVPERGDASWPENEAGFAVH
jgi:hypothetical protein